MFSIFGVGTELRIFGECLVSPKVLFFPFSSSVRTPCVRSSSSEDRKETASAKMCGGTDSDLFFLSFSCTLRKRERERTSLYPPLYGDDMVSFFPFSRSLSTTLSQPHSVWGYHPYYSSYQQEHARICGTCNVFCLLYFFGAGACYQMP